MTKVELTPVWFQTCPVHVWNSDRITIVATRLNSLRVRFDYIVVGEGEMDVES